MVVAYSQQCSIGKAIERTFDGEHPCNLCKHISKGRAAEKKHENQTPVAKADLICTIRGIVLLPPVVNFDYPELISSVPSGFEQTPHAPPRARPA